jgi:hypothetical protein
LNATPQDVFIKKMNVDEKNVPIQLKNTTNNNNNEDDLIFDDSFESLGEAEPELPFQTEIKAAQKRIDSILTTTTTTTTTTIVEKKNDINIDIMNDDDDNNNSIVNIVDDDDDENENFNEFNDNDDDENDDNEDDENFETLLSRARDHLVLSATPRKLPCRDLERDALMNILGESCKAKRGSVTCKIDKDRLS